MGTLKKLLQPHILSSRGENVIFCQENGGGDEIVNLLKHVRPGNGFEFKGDMFDKVKRFFLKDKKFLFYFGLWISKYVSSNLSKFIKIEMRNYYYLVRLR